MKAIRVLMFGPPGAGKGTQGKKLVDQIGIPFVVMGDILRQSVAHGDPVGKEAEAYMKRGDLVPDDVVIRMVMNRLVQDDCKEKGFLLDGFPRTRKQAEVLEKHMEEKGQRLDGVLYYKLSQEDAIERIEGRLTCSVCKQVYHIKTLPPKEEGRCDCGGELQQRMDDKREVIEKRFREYESKTQELLEYYREKNLLCEIPANREVDEIFADTLKYCESL